MTHNEQRSSAYKEWMAASITGVLYGGTNTVVGHPFDTIKTKMQAQSGHMEKVKYVDTIKKVYSTEGLTGFYRGWCPPTLGSMLFRSAQFSAFEFAFTSLEGNQTMATEVPGAAGL